MGKYTEQQLWDRYQKLPQILRDALFGVDTAEKLYQIGRKFGLTIEQTGFMAEETGYIIVGFTSPRDFIGVLINRLGIEADQARDIAKEINHQILFPIREALKQTHDFEIGNLGIPGAQIDTRAPERIPADIEKRPSIMPGLPPQPIPPPHPAIKTPPLQPPPLTPRIPLSQSPQPSQTLRAPLPPLPQPSQAPRPIGIFEMPQKYPAAERKINVGNETVPPLPPIPPKPPAPTPPLLRQMESKLPPIDLRPKPPIQQPPPIKIHPVPPAIPIPTQKPIAPVATPASSLIQSVMPPPPKPTPLQAQPLSPQPPSPIQSIPPTPPAPAMPPKIIPPQPMPPAQPPKPTPKTPLQPVLPPTLPTPPKIPPIDLRQEKIDPYRETIE